MISPEDVLIESIAEASLSGDSPALRQQQCAKLRASIRQYATSYAQEVLTDADPLPTDDDAA